jgi:tetratricopeptide (TPR) repeat protein
MTFNVMALVVVAALVFGTLGAIAINEIVNGGGDDTIEVDPERIDETEQDYRDQIEANPDDVRAIAALANYLGNLGRTDDAIQWYERALGITPDDVALRRDFASALASGGKMRDAELQYQRIIEAQPDDALSILALARLYRSWSPPRVDDAIATYQLAIERGGDSVVTTEAREELTELAGGSPVASPQASPKASPGPGS